MTKELFVATSYHHILTAIAKKYANNSEMDVLISNLSTGDAYWQLYLDKLRNNGWFGKVILFDERMHRPPSPAHPIATYKYELGGEKEVLKSIDGFDLSSYDMIYLIDDKMFPGSTVVRENLTYHLCEDTVLTYQMMKKANSSKVLAAPYNLICPVLKIFNYWHPVFGYAGCCETIESSSDEGLPERLPHKKIKVVDRMGQINAIPHEEKQKLCEMFLSKENVEYMRNNRDAVMLMTCPLKKGDMDFELQISVVEKLMGLYSGAKFIIKPHPRDDTDYKEAFPEAIVLNRSFPSEVFSFLDGIEIAEVVSVGSTSVNSCNFAKKKRLIMVNELETL